MGKQPRPSGLDEISGRVDLRGIPLFATPAIIGDTIGGVTWESLDLSGAQLDQLRISASQIIDCCFDRASMTALITGYRIDRVSLPQQPNLAVIRRYPSVLRSAIAWLRRPEASGDDGRLASIYERSLISHGAEDSDYCYDLGGYGNPALTEAATHALIQVQGSIRV